MFVIIREHYAPEVQKNSKFIAAQAIVNFLPFICFVYRYFHEFVVLTAVGRLCRWDVVFFSFPDSVVSV
jgi:hypothetical protein